MKKNILFFILFIATIQVYGQQVRDGINAAQFGLLEQKDATPAILKALDACFESGAPRLIVPKGTYHFYPDYALEEYLTLTGASNGLRRIAFPLINFEDLIIDGSESTFFMHGMMLPFEVQGCKNISIRNINIRFVSSVWGEGTVTEVNKDGSFFTIETNRGDSLELANGALSIRNEGENLPVKIVGWLRPGTSGSCSFSPSGIESSGVISAKPLSHGNFWIEVPGDKLPRKGWKLVWESNSERLQGKISPAFHLSGSDGVKLSNLSVAHAPGKVIVAEQSGNVMLDRLNVLPDSVAGRKLSVLANGVHFIGCQKKIVISNCKFSGMMGDAVSVSGPTLKIIKRISNNVLGVRQVNEKQWGSQFAQVGDTIRFIDTKKSSLCCERVVTRIRDLNEQYQELWFDRALPATVREGNFLINISRQPEVILRGNRFSNIIGNGISLQTSGKIMVEGNLIRSGKHGINLGGEFASAFQPVMLDQVFIKNNIFRRCGTGNANEALIMIGPIISDTPADTTYFHKDITIEGNTFYNEGKSILDAVATSGLVIRQNTVFGPASAKMTNPLIRLHRCKRVGIVGNRYMNKLETYLLIEQVNDLLFFNNEGIKSP
ncbi:right-handed parallel beta-helix repeat-containing protein [Prolixibacter sp. SD074]|uniref:right-handed parallel beta-helix repeat-containing protein n=1 Tax=Prolixibacter sp. SD074 TaxID=2652391 RepID=UPI001298F738|nr:right-handed parallel beta-helix repeat-containing protein [Prolixibacter sp. SD074]